MGKGKGRGKGGGRGRVATPLADKLAALCGSTLVETLDSATPEELKGRLVSLASHEAETEKAQAEDEELKEAKEVVKNLGGPFKDTLKGIKLQRTYISNLLDEKGTDVTKKEEAE